MVVFVMAGPNKARIVDVSRESMFLDKIFSLEVEDQTSIRVTVVKGISKPWQWCGSFHAHVTRFLF